MVTKSKNIKYSFAVRAAAFILALILFGASGYFASSAIRSFVNYNTYEERTFVQTDLFRRFMNIYEDILICNAEYFGSRNIDEFKETVQGKEIKANYDETKKKACNAFDLLQNAGVEVFVADENKFRYRYDNGTAVYYFSFDGELIGREEFDSYVYNKAYRVLNGETEEATTTVNQEAEVITPRKIKDIKSISNALNYLFSLGSDTNYGEIDRETLLKRIESEYESTIRNTFNDFDDYYVQFLDTEKDINYAIYLTNGNVITNCGATVAEGFEGAKKRLSENTLYCEAINAAGYSETVKTPEIGNREATITQLNRELVKEEPKLKTVTELEGRHGITGAVFSVGSNIKNGGAMLSEYYLIYNNFKTSVGGRTPINTCIVLFAVFFIIACALCIFLLISAGKTETGEIKLLFMDKVPLIINLALYLFLAISFGTLFVYSLVCEIYPSEISGMPLSIMELLGTNLNAFEGIMAALCFGSLIILSNSIARNIKAKKFLRHTLCGYIAVPFKSAFGKLKYIFETNYAKSDGKHFKIIALICVSVFAVLDFIGVMLCSNSDAFFVIMLIINIAALLFALLIVNAYSRIDEGTKQIRAGEINNTIDKKYMPPFLVRHADDILSIGDGLQSAVDSAVKDQRMKAELITNVSHDLKTPLTSIVSYVDLLKKCEIENEDAKKYIDILDEKSQRMKKLIEDLVEASKASSGAIDVHPVSVDLCEFAAQAAGENEDELKAKGIDIVLRIPDEAVTVYADPQKTGRIIENLFSNIKKYALENTRAYVEVSSDEKFGIIEFKNISKYELSVPAQELTERFVRGDASRNGEGSGLGLSIARNLCTLQKGEFSLITDGDLFKVTVKFPKK